MDFDLCDIIGDTIDHDVVKQAQMTIENLSKEINAQEISLGQRYRDFEQESKKV